MTNGEIKLSKDRKITIAQHVRELRTKEPVNNVVTGDIVGGDVVKDEEGSTDDQKGEDGTSKGDS